MIMYFIKLWFIWKNLQSKHCNKDVCKWILASTSRKSVFEGWIRLLIVITNMLMIILYGHFRGSHLKHKWMECRQISCKVVENVQHSWHTQLSFRSKVFIWRVIIGVLSLALKRRGFTSSTWFFCIAQMEDKINWFVQCLIAQAIWK